jgi:hypothetical protein
LSSEEPHGFRLFFAIVAVFRAKEIQKCGIGRQLGLHGRYEGIYFIPKSDSPGRHSIQFLNSALKRFDASRQSTGT